MIHSSGRLFGNTSVLKKTYPVLMLPRLDITAIKIYIYYRRINITIFYVKEHFVPFQICINK